MIIGIQGDCLEGKTTAVTGLGTTEPCLDEGDTRGTAESRAATLSLRQDSREGAVLAVVAGFGETLLNTGPAALLKLGSDGRGQR